VQAEGSQNKSNMDTVAEDIPNFKSAITEMDVIAWLHSRVARLKSDTGGQRACINITVHAKDDEAGPFSAASVHALGLCETFIAGDCGVCVEGAVEKMFRSLAAPNDIAAQKRRQADVLLAEASAMEAVAQSEKTKAAV
jgi:hypothetical protein